MAAPRPLRHHWSGELPIELAERSEAVVQVPRVGADREARQRAGGLAN
ncbi:MAG: hypothetical protein R3E42_11980 [Burkholderiaceae bacterium]